MKTNFLKRGILLLSIFSVFFTTACSDDDDDIDEITVSTDNLESADVVVGETYTFTVDCVEEGVDEDILNYAVRWYVNGVLSGAGLTYDFTPSAEGEYELYYTVLPACSTTGFEVIKSITLVAYDYVSDEDKIYVAKDNLFYTETQYTVPQSYWVVFDDEVSDEIAEKAVRWYLNDELITTGTQLDFTPTEAGTYNIKYNIKSHYSTTGEEVTKEVETVTYSSEGVFILSEPNYTGSETIRGINNHYFGTSTVDRFIYGDYTTFGVTNQCIVNWAGKLYNVATSATSGVPFSQFNAETGTCTATVSSVSGTCRSFSGITQDLGVLATSTGAYLVDLDGLTLDATPINGTEAGAYDTFVADGNLFVRVGTTAYAYELEGLSSSSEYVELGTIKSGFIKSKDGSVWGANGADLIKVNTRDLTVESVTIVDGGSVFVESWSWKPTSWVASTRENAFFYTTSTNGWSASEVVKYNIDTEAVTRNFIYPTDDTDGYSLYGTCLLYDSQRDEIACIATQGYTAYNGLYLFDADTKIKSYSVLYDTADGDVYGTKDLFFPCMMAPMKTY
ncbi:MAG: DUF5074 domain-containing protein [Rikenellaceae bacterium]